MPWTPITRKTAFGVAPSKPHKKQSNLCVTSYMMQSKADSTGGGRPGHPAMLRHNSKLGELCPPTFDIPKIDFVYCQQCGHSFCKKDSCCTRQDRARLHSKVP